MSIFMEIIAIQPPIDIGVDANNRSMFSTNYRAACVLNNSNAIELEIIKYLENRGAATLRVGLTGDTYYGSKALIPTGDGPFLLVKLTGGYTPQFTHTDGVQINILFQVSVWAKSQDVASTKSWQVHNVLNGSRDVEINL